MTQGMVAFRRVSLQGPDFISGRQLWSAALDLGAPVHAENQPPIVRNYSIRLLVQSAQPTATTVADGLGPLSYLEPLLLDAAITPFDFRFPRPGTTTVNIGVATFHPVVPVPAGGTANDRQFYSDLLVAPRSAWPPQGGFTPDLKTGLFELEAPPMQAVRGRIRVGYAQSDGPSLAQVLSIDWGKPTDTYARIFGSLKIDTAIDPVAGRMIILNLVPEGVELDLSVPDPFRSDAGAIDPGVATQWCPVRVRLVAESGGPGLNRLRLDVVGASGPSNLNDGLSWLSTDLANNGGCLSMQFNRGGLPPLSWPLVPLNPQHPDFYRCDVTRSTGGGTPADTLPRVRLRSEAVAVRIITREDFGGGEPGVAELTGHTAELQPRAPGAELPLRIVSAPPQPALPAGAPPMPTVTLGWQTVGAFPPDKIVISKFGGVIDAEPIAARLGDVWGASGAIAPGERPPCAFLALDRGWLQMPLPLAPPKNTPSLKQQIMQSAFQGVLRMTIDRTVNSDLPQVVDNPQSIGLGLVAAQRVVVDVAWGKPGDSSAKRTIGVTVTGAAGTLDGLLWMGEASPSPVEILPPLAAGPAALTSLPILFGVIGPSNWQLNVDQIDASPPSKQFNVTFTLPRASGATHPILAWRPHPQLALASSVAMTRTADSATEPSATRELVPAELARGTSPAVLTLNFFAGVAGLPSLGSPPPGSTLQGDGRWRWPWPSIAAAGPGPYPSSPAESAGVALASLTLPGIEFTPSDAATTVADLQVSLRYDLPILDELFANTKTPEPASIESSVATVNAAPSSAPMSPPPHAAALPTALEPARLATVWFANARRLARARTEADRVLLDDSQKPTRLWHPFTGLTNVSVRGIVEPYVWKVSRFTFQITSPGAAAADTAALGAYSLGADAPGGINGWFSGTAALGGLAGTFAIDPATGTLAPGAALPCKISVDGFAASSFQDPATGQLQDSRGLSLAAEPDLTSTKITSRAVTLRQLPVGASSVTATPSLLATLRKVVPVDPDGLKLELWFRDLPLTGTPAGGWTFTDPPDGVESAPGPDATTINRDRLANGLYEWRLYGQPPSGTGAPTGFYELDLAGPLSARPLRLLKLELAPDGSVNSLEVVVSVQVKTRGRNQPAAASKAGPPAPPPCSKGDPPFGAENSYATGNLATLTFAATAGKLALSGFDRYHVAGTTGGGTYLTLAAQTRLDLGIASGKPSMTWLAFDFVPGVTAAQPDIMKAYLTVRLFGQDMPPLSTSNARFVSQRLLADFDAPPAIDGLTLGKPALVWDVGGPSLSIANWTLAVALKAGTAAPPFVFTRANVNGGFRLMWLSLGIPIDGVAEKVDHDLGVIDIAINARPDPSQAPKLFRGFLLPTGTVRGKIVVVFRPLDSSPSYQIGSVFAEFAFTPDSVPTPQRITAIRHRHVMGRARGNSPTSHSQLFLDAAFGSLDAAGHIVPPVSVIEWPVGCVALPSPGSSPPFNADPNQLNKWTVDLNVVNGSDQPALVLLHQVQPRLSAHAFPLDSLGVENGELVLQRPWRFRAVVDHSLVPAGSPGWAGTSGAAAKTALKWTSLDEVCLFDLPWLVQQAKLPRADDYAFLARYQGVASPDVVRIAGVVRRSLAEAGFPTGRINDILATMSQAPQSLILAGASVTEVEIGSSPGSDPAPFGVTLVPQWILLWAAPSGANPDDWLGALAHLRQRDNKGGHTYVVAAFDAGAGAPHPLDGPSRYAFSAQDGTQGLIEGRFARMVGGPGKMLLPVDQSFVTDFNGTPPPSDPTARPLFVHTLLAMKTVADAFGTAVAKAAGKADPNLTASLFAQGISCITVTQLPNPPQDKPPPAPGAVRFSVTAWPVDGPPPDPAPPGVTLIVADRTSIRAIVLPAVLAATLVDPASDALVVDGQQLGDAQMRAFSLSATPRVVLLGRIDDSYLTIHGNEGPSAAQLDRAIASAAMPPPHVSWSISVIPPAATTRARVLRQPEDAFYAAPTLGWPQHSGREGDLAQGQASLGSEGVRRNVSLAWAGRTRGLAWPAAAWRRETNAEFCDDGTSVDGGYDYDAVAEMGKSAFITAGQRVAFRRRTAKNLRSPPDRLSVLAPPRARAPTVDAMSDAFANARVPIVTIDKDASPGPHIPPKARPMLDLNYRSGLAPMLPGPIEMTVTGQRPGVLLTQHEGLLLTSFLRPFDPDFSRFGRPASRGPLTVRQVRAPRSSALPETADLAVRRKTFIATDEQDSAGKILKPFKLVSGPAVIMRYDRNDGPQSPHAVALTIADPPLGRLSADWSGKIRLVATVSDLSPVSAVVALARLGLIPKDDHDTLALRAELRVGDIAVVFQTMVYGGVIDSNENPTDDPNQKRRVIDLTLDADGRKSAQLAVAAALLNVSADTPVLLSIRGGVSLGATVTDPAPAPFKIVPLDRTLALSLPLSGGTVRYDRNDTSPDQVTLAFADPPPGDPLAAGWSGRVRLVATVSDQSPASAAVALARVGLIPKSDQDSMKPHAELQVGDAVIVFQSMVYGGAIDDNGIPTDDPNGKRRLIDLTLAPDARKAAQAAVTEQIKKKPDAPVLITIRGGTSLGATDADPAPPAFKSTVLDAGAATALIPGPPGVLTFDLPHIPSQQRWLPVDTMTLAFGDPAYDRELGSPTTNYPTAIDMLQHFLALDRADYDLGATIYFAFWRRPNNSPSATPQPGQDPNPPEPPNPDPKDGSAWSLRLLLIPRDGSKPRPLRIAATQAMAQPQPKPPTQYVDDPRYVVAGCQPYAIPLSALREAFDPNDPNAERTAGIGAGDRLQVTVARGDDRTAVLSVSVGIVAEPVIPPPAATYGLATLGPPMADCIPVRTALFATAPLPQKIEFPDLYNDLVAGHVRRRGLFLWPLRIPPVAAPAAPAAAPPPPRPPFAFLVKVDRTGGGQLPDSNADFWPCEDLSK